MVKLGIPTIAFMINVQAIGKVNAKGMYILNTLIKKKKGLVIGVLSARDYCDVLTEEQIIFS